MARRAIAVVVLAAGLAGAAAGCGGESADLFAVDRAGEVPGARLRMVVNDGGTVRCNDAKAVRMPDELLLDARAIQRDLEEPAVEGLRLTPGPQSVLRYDVHTPDGQVRFADDSRGRPPVLDRLAYFVRRAAKEVCGLAR